MDFIEAKTIVHPQAHIYRALLSCLYGSFVRDRALLPYIRSCFVMYAGLFCGLCRGKDDGTPVHIYIVLLCAICRALLSYLWGSFVISVGLFCHICGALLSYLWGSFVISVGLFCENDSTPCIYIGLLWNICRALLSYMLGSFVWTL